MLTIQLTHAITWTAIVRNGQFTMRIDGCQTRDEAILNAIDLVTEMKRERDVTVLPDVIGVDDQPQNVTNFKQT